MSVMSYADTITLPPNGYYFRKFYAPRGGATLPPPETIVRIHDPGRNGAAANAGICGKMQQAFYGDIQENNASYSDDEWDFTSHDG